MLLAYRDAVDIGHGRGRLAAEAAASWARVDVAFRDMFGRIADVNEAWRSPEQADKNYRAYQAYINGTGPVAPIALPAAQSIHCRGYAIDTDDGYNATAVAILNDHGWYHTVYRNGRLVEPWHFEYFPARDNHRHEGTLTSGTARPFDTEGDDGMRIVKFGDDVFAFDKHYVEHLDKWNEAVFAAYITQDRNFKECRDQADFDATCEVYCVPAAKVRAVLHGEAYDLEGNPGRGRVWSLEFDKVQTIDKILTAVTS